MPSIFQELNKSCVNIITIIETQIPKFWRSFRSFAFSQMQIEMWKYLLPKVKPTLFGSHCWNNNIESLDLCVVRFALQDPHFWPSPRIQRMLGATPSQCQTPWGMNNMSYYTYYKLSKPLSTLSHLLSLSLSWSLLCCGDVEKNSSTPRASLNEFNEKSSFPEDFISASFSLSCWTDFPNIQLWVSLRCVTCPSSLAQTEKICG